MPAAAAKPVFDESFGRRLRRERERRQIPLASIAENTKISASLFEDLERDDASRWPSGIFRRSFIKSYARAIGLDADAVAQEFLERFPDPNDPKPLISPEAAAPAVAHNPTPANLRLTLAAESSFAHERLGSFRDRVAAIVCDGVVVVTLGLAMYAVLGSFWMPLCIALIGYYAGGVLIFGNTPGVCLCAPGERKRGSSLAASAKAIVSTFAPLLERLREHASPRRSAPLRAVVAVPRKHKAHPVRPKPELIDNSHTHDAFEAAQLIHTRQGTENA